MESISGFWWIGLLYFYKNKKIKTIKVCLIFKEKKAFDYRGISTGIVMIWLLD